MASQVEICNRALVKVGGGQISSIEDRKPAAVALKKVYETVLKSELSKKNWNFAKKRAALPKLTEAPAWGFANQFQLPEDCLKVIQVNDVFIIPGLSNYITSDNSPWSIEDGKVLTDFDAPLKIKYIKNITDPQDLSALFVEVFASKLAQEICFEVTQSRTGIDVAKDDYKMAVREAVQANAIELPPQGIADNEWMLGRL